MARMAQAIAAFARPDAAEKIVRSVIAWSRGRAAMRAAALESGGGGY